MSAYTHHGECSTSDPCKRCFEFGETTERRRIIKLLEEMPMMIYYAVANNGRILDKPCSPVVIELEAAIALIKGEK